MMLGFLPFPIMPTIVLIMMYPKIQQFVLDNFYHLSDKQLGMIEGAAMMSAMFAGGILLSKYINKRKRRKSETTETIQSIQSRTALDWKQIQTKLNEQQISRLQTLVLKLNHLSKQEEVLESSHLHELHRIKTKELKRLMEHYLVFSPSKRAEHESSFEETLRKLETRTEEIESIYDIQQERAYETTTTVIQQRY